MLEPMGIRGPIPKPDATSGKRPSNAKRSKAKALQANTDVHAPAPRATPVAKKAALSAKDLNTYAHQTTFKELSRSLRKADKGEDPVIYKPGTSRVKWTRKVQQRYTNTLLRNAVCESFVSMMYDIINIQKMILGTHTSLSANVLEQADFNPLKTMTMINVPSLTESGGDAGVRGKFDLEKRMYDVLMSAPWVKKTASIYSGIQNELPANILNKGEAAFLEIAEMSRMALTAEATYPADTAEAFMQNRFLERVELLLEISKAAKEKGVEGIERENVAKLVEMINMDLFLAQVFEDMNPKALEKEGTIVHALFTGPKRAVHQKALKGYIRKAVRNLQGGTKYALDNNEKKEPGVTKTFHLKYLEAIQATHEKLIRKSGKGDLKLFHRGNVQRALRRHSHQVQRLSVSKEERDFYQVLINFWSQEVKAVQEAEKLAHESPQISFNDQMDQLSTDIEALREHPTRNRVEALKAAIAKLKKEVGVQTKGQSAASPELEERLRKAEEKKAVYQKQFDDNQTEIVRILTEIESKKAEMDAAPHTEKNKLLIALQDMKDELEEARSLCRPYLLMEKIIHQLNEEVLRVYPSIEVYEAGKQLELLEQKLENISSWVSHLEPEMVQEYQQVSTSIEAYETSDGTGAKPETAQQRMDRYEAMNDQQLRVLSGVSELGTEKGLPLPQDLPSPEALSERLDEIKAAETELLAKISAELPLTHPQKARQLNQLAYIRFLKHYATDMKVPLKALEQAHQASVDVPFVEYKMVSNMMVKAMHAHRDVVHSDVLKDSTFLKNMMHSMSDPEAFLKIDFDKQLAVLQKQWKKSALVRGKTVYDPKALVRNMRALIAEIKEVMEFAAHARTPYIREHLLADIHHLFSLDRDSQGLDNGALQSAIIQFDIRYHNACKGTSDVDSDSESSSAAESRWVQDDWHGMNGDLHRYAQMQIAHLETVDREQRQQVFRDRVVALMSGDEREDIPAELRQKAAEYHALVANQGDRATQLLTHKGKHYAVVGDKATIEAKLKDHVSNALADLAAPVQDPVIAALGDMATPIEDASVFVQERHDAVAQALVSLIEACEYVTVGQQTSGHLLRGDSPNDEGWLRTVMSRGTPDAAPRPTQLVTDAKTHLQSVISKQELDANVGSTRVVGRRMDEVLYDYYLKYPKYESVNADLEPRHQATLVKGEKPKPKPTPIPITKGTVQPTETFIATKVTPTPPDSARSSASSSSSSSSSTTPETPPSPKPPPPSKPRPVIPRLPIHRPKARRIAPTEIPQLTARLSTSTGFIAMDCIYRINALLLHQNMTPADIESMVDIYFDHSVMVYLKMERPNLIDGGPELAKLKEMVRQTFDEKMTPYLRHIKAEESALVEANNALRLDHDALRSEGLVPWRPNSAISNAERYRQSAKVVKEHWDITRSTLLGDEPLTDPSPDRGQSRFIGEPLSLPKGRFLLHQTLSRELKALGESLEQDHDDPLMDTFIRDLAQQSLAKFDPDKIQADIESQRDTILQIVTTMKTVDQFVGGDTPRTATGKLPGTIMYWVIGLPNDVTTNPKYVTAISDMRLRFSTGIRQPERRFMISDVDTEAVETARETAFKHYESTHQGDDTNRAWEDQVEAENIYQKHLKQLLKVREAEAQMRAIREAQNDASRGKG